MSYRLDAYRTRMQAAFDGAEIRLDQAESLANQTQALRVEGESGDRLAEAVYGEDAGAASVITNSYREQFGYEEDPAR